MCHKHLAYVLDKVETIVIVIVLQEGEAYTADVDLFMLSEDHARLVINPKWLQHLQVLMHDQPGLMFSLAHVLLYPEPVSS